MLDKLRSNLVLLKEGKFKKFFERVLYKISSTKLSYFIFYSRFFILSFPVSENNVGQGISSLTTRIASITELNCLNRLFPNETYPIRFNRGDICVIAERDGQIIGMEWMQFNKEKEGGIDYAISLPEKSIWVHDAFVEPAYRKKRVWGNLISEIIKYCQRNSLSKVYTAIYSENEISMKVHSRYGFRFEKEIVYVRFMGINIIKEINLALIPQKTRLAFTFSLRRN